VTLTKFAKRISSTSHLFTRCAASASHETQKLARPWHTPQPEHSLRRLVDFAANYRHRQKLSLSTINSFVTSNTPGTFRAAVFATCLSISLATKPLSVTRPLLTMI
jgi:hypothetical protein